jgi:ketosteroid isomerase-like protein
MAQHFPTASGSTQIREAYDKTFSLITLSVTFMIHEIIVISDTYAIARTSSNGTVMVKANGTKSNEGNQELFVLQKEDGEWKIARYCFCSVLPPH